MSSANPWQDQDTIRWILAECETWAVVGLGDNPFRDAHRVAQFLQQHGKRIVPVHPGGGEALGEKVYRTLDDIPFPVDVVDVFRRAEHAPEVARQAVEIGAKVLWLQQDIVSDEAARIATEGGLDVIMGVCIRNVRERLMRWEGSEA